VHRGFGFPFCLPRPPTVHDQSPAQIAAESNLSIVDLIAGKRSAAVLISGEDWRAIQETMFVLSVPGMRESIRDAMAEPLAKSAKALGW
jgi:PHD/YefM family antitoxin component YafN of YafNO toxin-antitoxin module